MPSSDSTKIDLDATFSYKPKVKANIYQKKEVSDPKQQR